MSTSTAAAPVSEEQEQRVATKKRGAAGGADEQPAEKKSKAVGGGGGGAKASKKDKKDKKEAPVKKEPAVATAANEDDPVGMESATGEEESKKKKPNGPKRKVERFDPHTPHDYLNVIKYWKHMESLNQGLRKAQAVSAKAEDEGELEQMALAASQVNRYTLLIGRMEQRRQDTVQQLQVLAPLLPYGAIVEPLLTLLLAPFAGKPDPPAPPAAVAAASADKESTDSKTPTADE